MSSKRATPEITDKKEREERTPNKRARSTPPQEQAAEPQLVQKSSKPKPPTLPAAVPQPAPRRQKAVAAPSQQPISPRDQDLKFCTRILRDMEDDKFCPVARVLLFQNMSDFLLAYNKHRSGTSTAELDNMVLALPEELRQTARKAILALH